MDDISRLIRFGNGTQTVLSRSGQILFVLGQLFIVAYIGRYANSFIGHDADAQLFDIPLIYLLGVLFGLLGVFNCQSTFRKWAQDKPAAFVTQQEIDILRSKYEELEALVGQRTSTVQ